MDPYFQCFSCVLSYYRYLICTCSTSITSLIISSQVHLLSTSNHVPLINYDVGQLIMSPITVEQTVIRIDLAQLGFPYHTTYVGPSFGLTYINLHSNPPKHEVVYATREHSTPPPCATPGGFIGWVHATLTISHVLVRSCLFT